MNLRVEALLASPLCGDPPMLDAIIECESSFHNGIAKSYQKWEQIPEYGDIPSPILRRRIGGMLIPLCSSPIVSEAPVHEFISKRYASELASFLDPKHRKKLDTSSGHWKSYHLPLKVRAASRVTWFAVGDRRGIWKLLQRVTSIGKKRSVGYGRISRWAVEPIDRDISWFATDGDGEKMLLMRPLPHCDDLPQNMTGYAVDYGAVQPPYWHPARYVERVVPC